MHKVSYLQAIREAMAEEMVRDESVFLMGEDVRSNMFGSSGGLADEFGNERVRDTPISEAGFVGAAAGAAMVGMRPIVDMTIAPFLYVAMDQLVSITAKSTYLYGGQAKVPVVIRAGMFYGRGSAAQHSDRPYPMFMTVPGLKIIAASNPYDLKGLLKTAIRDDDPVMSFEDGTLWSSSSEIPDEEYLIPFGKAEVKREGDDVTIVAVAGSVPHALTAAEDLAEEGFSAEVIDPRTLVPLDRETILASVHKTGRLVIAEPAHETGGVAANVSAIVAEEGFWDLAAPIMRVTTPDTHIPFSPPLEHPLYPNPEKISLAARKTLEELIHTS